MKKIQNSKMVELQGGRNGYWTGFSCGSAGIGLAITAGLLVAATGPIGAVAFAIGGAAFTSGAAGACAISVATGA